ncbi:MAG TPA: glycosyltransferase family 1 protein [Acidimicrobiia bacterium]|nr:glycosyltransferase family 1 protein [Acidimicrobiia bacterium]
MSGVRVGFDVSALLSGDTGVARYVRELGAAIERADVDVVRFAIGRGRNRSALPQATRRIPVPLRLVQRTWTLAGSPRAEQLAPGCDIVHTPDLVPPPTRRPLVLTVHDLVALEHPDLHPPRSSVVQRHQLAAAAERATVVIAVSQATADALTARGVDPDRIVVAPNGVTALPRPRPELAPPGRFLLAVGSLTPRKGLDTLLAAFARADLPGDVRLVLAGPPGFRADSVTDAIVQHDLGDRVDVLGRVSDERLAALYAACTAVCAPSIAEGFGLPILEAGAAGAPVIASDIAVFREVAGEAAWFARSRDVRAWAGALERVVGDKELRDDLRERGIDVARQYTWDRSAALTRAAYERAVA